jgi:hypothetical protein
VLPLDSLWLNSEVPIAGLGEITVSVALIIQAIAKKMAAMMASMPHCFPCQAAIIAPEKSRLVRLFLHMTAARGKCLCVCLPRRGARIGYLDSPAQGRSHR